MGHIFPAYRKHADQHPQSRLPGSVLKHWGCGWLDKEWQSMSVNAARIAAARAPSARSTKGRQQNKSA